MKRENKRFILITIYFLLTLTINVKAQWIQKGQTIEGQVLYDLTGRSVSVNNDGSIVAVGATWGTGDTALTGNVRVFEDSSGIWIQKGNILKGENYGDEFGRSVSLNADGSVIVVGVPFSDKNGTNFGCVKVFRDSSNQWVQMGSSICGNALISGQSFGKSVSLNDDGNILVVGATTGLPTGDMTTGCVEVYEFVSGSWIQKGNTSIGEGTLDGFGCSVSISSNGLTFVAGAINNYGVNGCAGHARVFEFNSGNWIQKGSDIDGEYAGDNSGISVSINSDASIVAVGANLNGILGVYKGHVRIYEYINTDWIQLGNDIDGEADRDGFGHSVSIDSVGHTVVVGAPGNSNNVNGAGQAKVYNYLSGSWIQSGNDFYGDSIENYLGVSTSVSSNGETVAFGASSDYSGPGYVKVFRKSAVGISETNAKIEHNIYPNPTTGIITIDYKGVKSIEIINSLGQSVQVLDGNQNTINIGSYPSGIYFIKYSTKNSVVVEKIILK